MTVVIADETIPEVSGTGYEPTGWGLGLRAGRHRLSAILEALETMGGSGWGDDDDPYDDDDDEDEDDLFPDDDNDDDDDDDDADDLDA